MSKKADIGALVIPKGDVPARADAPGMGQALKTYTHTVSLRQTEAEYRRLARYCTDASEKTGQRITKQMVIETALARYLDEMEG